MLYPSRGRITGATKADMMGWNLMMLLETLLQCNACIQCKGILIRVCGMVQPNTMESFSTAEQSLLHYAAFLQCYDDTASKHSTAGHSFVMQIS
jgi:hypothetical protein